MKVLLRLIIIFLLTCFFSTNVFSQNCPAYSNTVSSENTACANQTYYFEVQNTSCPGTITFNVTGNYGPFGYEIDWEIVSNLTSNVIASGFGANNAPINVTVGPIDPNTEGQVFTLNVYDLFGDGFNGTGNINIIQNGNNLVSISGDFGSSTSSIFGPTIAISAATLTVNTPSGPVSSTIQGCGDFSTPITLSNANFCNVLSVNLPWEIRCNVTNTVISNGTHNLTVYPQVPSSSDDLVAVTWNINNCGWDVNPQNDCDNLDIGNIFSISPDPATNSPNTCSNSSQTFEVEYLGLSGRPNCCLTGGALVPITYSANNSYSNFIPSNSPFGGINNSAYSQVLGNNFGGTATSVTLTVEMSTYSFPDPPGLGTDNSYWVTIYVDGNPIYDQNFLASSPNFSQTFTLVDIPNGYNENSVIDVYFYPNTFNSLGINTTYVPNTSTLSEGEWTAVDFSISLNVTFSEEESSSVNCTFSTTENIICCSPATIPDVNNNVCSGNIGDLNIWQTSVENTNPSCLVFSSVTPVAGSTLPNNTFPDGINNTCTPVIQTVRAYAYCDVNGNGTINNGDNYTLLSTFNLTVNPAPPTLVADNGGCGTAPTASIECNGTRILSQSGTAPTSMPCGASVNTTNINGTFTANQIATALGNTSVTCYSDQAYNITASCNQAPNTTGDFDTIICNGTTFSYNGTTYGGNALNGTETFIAANGCDSVVTVTVYELASDSTFENTASCNPSDTGTVTHSFINVDGCDSLHTVMTDLLASDSTFENTASCNPSDTGTVTHSFINVDGCDSLHTVMTDLLASDSTFENTASCNPSDTGTVTHSFINVDGCDSLHTVMTDLLASDSTFENTASCNPSDTGTVTHSFINVDGCDSLHTVMTDLLASDSTFENTASCNPSDTGTVTHSFINVDGCDSLHTVMTDLLASDSTFENTASCNPSDTGTVTHSFINVDGCDSLHTVMTDLLASDSTFENTASCNPSDTGTVTHSFINVDGCDSLHTVMTDLLASDSTFENTASCNPSDTGTVTHSFINVDGCDSLHTVMTDLLASDSTFENTASCNPSDTGTVTYSFINANGCDSLHTVMTDLLASDSTFENTASCNPNDTGTVTHSFVNANGCDSLHTVMTDLLASDSTFENTASCNPSDTGTVTHSFINVDGCDSLHTVMTDLLASDSTFENTASCNPNDTGTVTHSFVNANGCDSLHTVMTDLLASDSTFENTASCNPSDTGTVTHSFINVDGCDSLHTVMTDLLASDSTFENTASCNPNDTGTVTHSFVNANGCDSLHTVMTDLLASDSTFENTASCNPSDTGTVTHSFINVDGCDSLHTVMTDLLASDSTFENTASCNPSDTGTVTHSFINANGCDSLHTVMTDLLASDSTFENTASCNPNDTGTVTHSFVNANGCDSLHTVMTDLLASDSTFENTASCNPSDTGTVTHSFINANGCDSLHTVMTDLLASDSTFRQITACDSAQINGTWYYSSADINENFINQNSCDSTHVTNLIIADARHHIENIIACDSVEINGTIYYSSTTFDANINHGAINGCDSLITFNITINHPAFDTINVTECDSAFVNGNWYFTSTNFDIVSPNGATSSCDSITTYNITINNTTSSVDVQTACDSYTWIDGNTYTVSNSSATHTLNNAAGCDSVVTLNLIISNSTTNTINIDICPYEFPITLADGSIINEAVNNYDISIPNAIGCDSLITYSITINHLAFDTINVTECDSAFVNGNWYFTSTNFDIVSPNGATSSCDSITTYNITINNTTSSVDVQTACDSYTWIDGNTYTVSNSSATHTLNNAAGCDSVVTLNLIISNSTTNTINIDICPYELPITLADGSMINEAVSNYDISIPNAIGCDSVITYNIGTYTAYSVSPNFIEINSGDNVKFVIENENNNTQFTYNSTTGELCSANCDNYIIYPTDLVNYYYFNVTDTLTDCNYLDTLKVDIQYSSELNVPNIFTPNGDGQNDIYRAYGKDIVQYQLEIFDRWGGRMFSSNELTYGWNGYFNNLAVESGNYIAIIKATGEDGQKYEITQNIKLVR